MISVWVSRRPSEKKIFETFGGFFWTAGNFGWYINLFAIADCIFDAMYQMRAVSLIYSLRFIEISSSSQSKLLENVHESRSLLKVNWISEDCKSIEAEDTADGDGDEDGVNFDFWDLQTHCNWRSLNPKHQHSNNHHQHQPEGPQPQYFCNIQFNQFKGLRLVHNL